MFPDKYRLRFLRAPLDDLGADQSGGGVASPPPPDAGAGGGAGAAPPAPGDELANEFIADLPADLKANPSLAKFRDKASLAKSYVNLEHLIGNEKVPVPKDANDQEGWDRFWKAAGKPEAADKYEFQKPEKMPEGVTYDENMEKWWRDVAHRNNLTKGQASGLFKEYGDRLFSQADASVQDVGRQRVACKVELQRDWGAEYGARWAVASAAFDALSPGTQAMLTRSGATRDPAFIKDLYDLRVKAHGESDPKLGNRDTGQFKSPEQIRAELAAFRTANQAALNDLHHPQHQHVVDELTRMNEALFKEPESA